MKKNTKYILLGLFTLSFLIVSGALVWIYTGDPPPICITLAKGFFVPWLVCFFLMQFYIAGKDAKAGSKGLYEMKDCAHRELCSTTVIINHYYHLMIKEKDVEDRARLEASYYKAREAFQHKAEMCDAILQTRTVLIEEKDDDGNIIEITFDSRPA